MVKMNMEMSSSIESRWRFVDEELREWFFGEYGPQSADKLEMMTSIFDNYLSIKGLRKTDTELFKAMC